MPQLFSRSADSVFRLALASGVIVVCALAGCLFVLARSPYLTDQGLYVEQPVPFSHQHHVGDVGIDCRYCHQSVETSAVAGIPSTDICMKCHQRLWNTSEMLEPVRNSYRQDSPLAWNRVHDLPDFVYFNHGIHLKAGVGCYSCHGRVDAMPLMKQEHSLTMKWCLDCHRDPGSHLRPREFLFAPAPLEELLPNDELHRTQLTVANTLTVAKESSASLRVDCYTCHR